MSTFYMFYDSFGDAYSVKGKDKNEAWLKAEILAGEPLYDEDPYLCKGQPNTRVDVRNTIKE